MMIDEDSTSLGGGEPTATENGDAPAAASTGMGDFARRILKARRRRDRYFDPLLFSNPAWDVLLSLFIAREEGRRVSIVDGCIAAAVPPTTTLRWLAFLQQQGLVIESRDGDEPELKYVALSDQAGQAVDAYLSSLVNLGLTSAPAAAPPAAD
jgi:hypothetical protein